MRKLAGEFFEDGLPSLGRWCVKQNDCYHVLAEGLRDARELLGQHPYTEACVASRKTELD